VRQTGDRTPRSCQILTTFVFGFASLLVGCDECEVFQTECDGNTLRSCIPSSGDGPFATNHWGDYPCPVACRTIGNTPMCVSSVAPVPECAGGDFKTCLDGAPTTCRSGYRFNDKPCEASTHCLVSDACGPICVTGDSPEPLCTQDYICDAGDLVQCVCGYFGRRIACEAPRTCRQPDGYIAGCFEMSTP
jgi:hypothetical protein